MGPSAIYIDQGEIDNICMSSVCRPSYRSFSGISVLFTIQ